jgi:hypothetical protein
VLLTRPVHVRTDLVAAKACCLFLWDSDVDQAEDWPLLLTCLGIVRVSSKLLPESDEDERAHSASALSERFSKVQHCPLAGLVWLILPILDIVARYRR